jgi:hypothetical protein
VVAGAGRRPAVIDGPAYEDPAVMAWADGERERWLSRIAVLDHGREEPGWAAEASRADRLSDLSPRQIPWLFARGPEDAARALLGKPLYTGHRWTFDQCRVAVARFELDALPLALEQAGAHADRWGLLLLPFQAPEVATLVAGWQRHLGSARLWARLWLRRHPGAAARALIPAAVGRTGRARQNAEDALLHLADAGHRPVLLTTAAGYGESVLTAVTALLGPDTPAAEPGGRALTVVPTLFALDPEAARSARQVREAAHTTRRGRTGWLPPDGLPEIRLADGSAMPEDDTARLLTELTRSRLDDAPEPPPGDPGPPGSDMPVAVESPQARQPLVRSPGPEAEKLIAACDRRSLAGFGRVLLEQWLSENMPPATAWALLAQAHLGDDTTMDLLAPLVRSWPGKNRNVRAIDGWAVLATVGTDVALRHLLSIEAGMSDGSSNGRAYDYLTQAAARRGLSVTQLADRLAITHGLDDGITLDYGPRTFTVAADEHLTAYAVGADGRRLARPPKPGVRDTRPEAYQQFLRLKKDLRATATAQSARLEKDMHRRRLRPASDLPAVVLPHPILGPIARRLLWGEYDAGYRLVRALRIAEDDSFADLHDATAAVSGHAPVGIVHPAELGDDLLAWGQIFADYEILQPFPQLTRPSVALTAEQRAATALPGFGPVPANRLTALLGRWWRGNESSERPHTQLARDLPGGLTLLVEVSPGVSPSAYRNPPSAEQWITEIWLDHDWSDHWQRDRRLPMGAADPAELSEVLVEVYGLRD